MPAIAALAVDQQIMSRRGPELIELGPRPVEGDFQRILRVAAGGIIAPENFDQFASRDDPRPMTEQIRHEHPHFFRAAVAVRDLPLAGADGKLTECTNV